MKENKEADHEDAKTTKPPRGMTQQKGELIAG